MRKINDLVSGKPSNREGLWAMTNKQASGIGHTLSASACFRIQAHQNMQSLLGFDSIINKHPGLHTISAKPVSTLQVIKLVLDVATFVVAVSELSSAHGLMEGGPIIEVWH
jgi:hypothetical protein